ncbi:MAG: hypothetical protein M3O35_00605 [Acidobacteriota bacterium]|nr:hypothetical protein [Acidobacteriota bacterium]
MSVLLQTQGDSVHIIAAANQGNIVVGAKGGASGAPSTDTPGNPTIISVPPPIDTVDGDGKPLKQVTVLYTAPSPLGSFTGVWVYLDAPDTSGVIPKADGTGIGSVADGTTPANGTFEPLSIGFFDYDPATSSVVFTVPAPTVGQLARVYLAPGSKGTKVPAIQHGVAGESPNWQFLLTPPAALFAGREYAPLINDVALAPVPSGWDANPHVDKMAAGDQFWEVAVQWSWPTSDQNISTLGGINFVLDDGITQKYLGNIAYSSNLTQFTIPHQAVRVGTVAYTLWFISYSVDLKNNQLVAGVTPFVRFTVTRKTGIPGIENCALVQSDGVNPFITVTPVAGADGSSLLTVTGYWKKLNPGDAGYDPAFGGAEIVVIKPADVPRSIAKGTLSPIANDISNPATSQSCDFYLRSVDINGVPNTIVDGVTPKVTITVGGGSQLDLSKVKTGTFAAGQFTVVSGAFTVTALSAAIINTGILQVGGGGSRVSQFKIFDTLGSSIGWIGDDTGGGGSGYVGAWFKQCRIGGSSPGTAQVVADASGNVTISGSLIVGAVGSANSVPATGVTAGTFGSGVIYAGTINCSQLNAGTISAAISLTSPTITVTSGTITVNIDSSHYIMVSDSSTGYVGQMTNTGISASATGGAFAILTSLGVNTNGQYAVNSTRVVGARQTGWAVPTGTINRATYDTATVTVGGLAQIVAALQADLRSHGLIGA